MSTTDLDRMLNEAAAPLPAEAVDQARRLASTTMPDRLRAGKPARRRWLLPVVVSGAIALTAGASTTVAVMSHWAGVGMPLDNVRNELPIPVSWIGDDGSEHDCRAWIELRHPAPDDRETLDAAIAAHDWNGLGQELFDAAPAANDPDNDERVSDGLVPVLQDFTAEVFPGIHWFCDGVDTSERAVDAWGMTCVPESE